MLQVGFCVLAVMVVVMSILIIVMKIKIEDLSTWNFHLEQENAPLRKMIKDLHLNPLPQELVLTVKEEYVLQCLILSNDLEDRFKDYPTGLICLDSEKGRKNVCLFMWLIESKKYSGCSEDDAQAFLQRLKDLLARMHIEYYRSESSETTL